jgi:hypothetical protein
MQQNLTALETHVLVEMLIKDTEFYRQLCEANDNAPQTKKVLSHIDLIINELNSRGGGNDAMSDKDPGATTTE